MKSVLILILTVSAVPANAGWWARFKNRCEQALVAENPYPYAEHDTIDLLNMYRRHPDPVVLKEIIYRRRVRWWTDEHERHFWTVFRRTDFEE